MSELKLTLEPELESPSLGGVPTLTLDSAEAEKKSEPEVPEEPVLSPEEQKVVDDFVGKSISQVRRLSCSTARAPRRRSRIFSDTALQNVRTKDLGEVGDEISDLVVELRGFDVSEEEEKGLFGFFKKQANKLDGLKARYDKAEVNVNKIASSLEGPSGAADEGHRHARQAL